MNDRRPSGNEGGSRKRPEGRDDQRPPRGTGGFSPSKFGPKPRASGGRGEGGFSGGPKRAWKKNGDSAERGSAPRRVASGPRESDGAKDSFIAKGVRVVHEDDDIIVVEKPAGLVTADPARASSAPGNMVPSAKVGQTLFDFVKQHVRTGVRIRGRRKPRAENPADMPGRVWVVHRLDKEASGLLVFAKSQRAFDSLKAELASKKAHRLYVVVAEGTVGPVGHMSTKQSMIHEDRGPRRSDDGTFDDGRRLAITHYKVVAVGKDRSLLHVRLETGRKNQIRVHMQELGHPLAGDSRFGAGSDPLGRVGLHASELGFTHPGTGKDVRFVSPAPVSFYRNVGASVPGGRTDAPTDDERAPSHDDTSWNEVAQWYDAMLEDKGNDHYERVILPGTLELLGDLRGKRVLDVACGQGILSRRMAGAGAKVVGIDAAAKLIEAAKERSKEIEYHAADARDLAAIGLQDFDAAACVMALTNMDPLASVFDGIAGALKAGGVFVAVIAHPAFRNPGETGWAWDAKKGKQYRRVESYLSQTKKAIDMAPGASARGGEKLTTTTFHRPLGVYVRALSAAGLVVDCMEEWISKREATSGPRAPEENRSRTEIPLFLAIRALKK